MIGLVLLAAPPGALEAPRRCGFLLRAPALPHLLARWGRCDQRRVGLLGGGGACCPALLQGGAPPPGLRAGRQLQAEVLARAALPAGLTAQHCPRPSRQAQQAHMPVLQRRGRPLALHWLPAAGPAPLGDLALLRALLAVYQLHAAHRKAAPFARPALGPVQEVPAAVAAQKASLRAQKSARLPQCGDGGKAGQCAGLPPRLRLHHTGRCSNQMHATHGGRDLPLTSKHVCNPRSGSAAVAR